MNLMAENVLLYNQNGIQRRENYHVIIGNIKPITFGAEKNTHNQNMVEQCQTL